MDDGGFVAVSRCFVAREMLSRNKACPVEYRGDNARARASRKIGRGRQNGHLGKLVCALGHPAPTHPLSPPAWAKREGEGAAVCHPPSTSTRHGRSSTRLWEAILTSLSTKAAEKLDSLGGISSYIYYLTTVTGNVLTARRITPK